MKKLMVTPEEAAEALSISRSRVYALLGSGDLPSAKLGRVRRVYMRDLENFAERCVDRGMWDAPLESGGMKHV